MTPLYALVIILCIIGAAELIAEKSKARLSMFFLTGLFALLLSWGGLPKDIWYTSNLVTMGATLVGFILTTMGTVMDRDELLEQWKTVIIGFGVVVCIVILIIGVAPLIIDRNFAFGAAPVVAGGAVAQIIMGGIFQEKGLADAEAFCLLILTLQSLVGVPITSLILRKEAKRYIESGEYKNSIKDEIAVTYEGKKERKTLIPPLPKAYQKPAVLLAKTGLVTALGYYISGLTGGKLNALLLCLVFGIIGKQIGFLEKGGLSQANSFSIINYSVIALIFANAGQITPQMVASMISPLLVVFVLGLIAISIGGFVMAKLLKMNPMMGIAIGLTALYGMPATFLIPEEVANAVGENDEQVAALKSYMLPKLLTAGFATVSIASVVIVGFVTNMI